MFKEIETDDSEATGSMVVESASGVKYDVSNISGARKRQLIMDGEIGIDVFVSPPNMPGKKLAAMRAAHAASVQSGIDGEVKKAKIKVNPFATGDLVEHKGHVSEVLEVTDKGVLKLIGKKGQKKMVHFTKVTPAVTTNEGE